MFKRLLLLPVAVLTVFSASAQWIYSFKDTTTPYTALSGATSLNGSLVWDEELLTAPMPFTWTMNGNKAVNFFYYELGFQGALADTSSSSNFDGFIFNDADLADRGMLSGGSSLSPIRYLTTGSAPNRIFKMEIANAGFYDEMDNYNTNNDFVNMQIWVYETSNIVEYHYGPSSLVHASEYFTSGSGPMAGYIRDFDGTSGELYYLKGAPAAPALDSVTFPAAIPAGLTAWPADGKVYRFSPKTGGVGVASTASSQIMVSLYPSPAATNLYVNYQADHPDQADYQICSLTGAVVHRGNLNKGIQTIDINTLASGTYYLQVRSKTASGNFRFVKQ